jgi:hypothetical protein
MKKRNGSLRNRAAQVPEDDITSILTSEGGSVLDYFLLGGGNMQAIQICFWHPRNGLMALLIEDNVRAYAVKTYLQRIGAPHFQNHDALRAKAFRERWPALISGIAHGEWIGDLYLVKVFPACKDDANLRFLVDDVKYAPRLAIDLSDGRVTDTGLTWLHRLSQLEEVDISGNLITDNGVRELRRALPGCSIKSAENKQKKTSGSNNLRT